MKPTLVTILRSLWVLLTAYSLVSGNIEATHWINGTLVCVCLVGVAYVSSLEDE